MTSPAQQACTVTEALQRSADLQAVSESWRLEGELLLAAAIGCRRERLYSGADQILSAAALRQFESNLARRLNGEPIAYLLGDQPFLDFELRVDPRVLIPRPETELLVEAALAATERRAGDSLCVADLGTGSGAIAIAIARARPGWRIQAIDVSEAALDVARDNGARLAPGRIEFLEGDWCAPLGADSCDLICANPPYVAEGDPHLLADGLPFEPALALTAADDGMAEIVRLVADCRRVLRPGGRLYIEHGSTQAGRVAALLSEAGLSAIETHRDYGGHERFTTGLLEACL